MACPEFTQALAQHVPFEVVQVSTFSYQHLQRAYSQLGRVTSLRGKKGQPLYSTSSEVWSVLVSERIDHQATCLGLTSYRDCHHMVPVVNS